MKKAGISLILLSLILSLFTGCSNKEQLPHSEEGVTHLKFWAPLSGGDSDYMKDLVKEFNKENPDVKVEMLTLKAQEYYTKLRISVVSNQSPDIAIVHASRLAELNHSDMIQNLDGVAPKAGVKWESFNQNILSATIINNQHYALPLDTHALIMYVNKNVLKEAGILDAKKRLELGQNAEDFMKLLQAIKNNSPEGNFPLSITSTGDAPFRFWWTLYSQMGGKLLTPDGKKAAFNNPKSKEALEFMNQLMSKNLWPKNIRNGGELFTANKAAIHINGVWMTGALEKNKNLEFLALPIPMLYEKNATWGDSHTFVIPTKKSDSEKKKIASLKFANWIVDHSSLWAKAGHVPSKTSVLNSKEFRALPYRSQYADVLDYVSFMPNSDKVTIINDVLKKHFNLLMNGQSSIEETLNKAEKEVNNILSE